MGEGEAKGDEFPLRFFFALWVPASANAAMLFCVWFCVTARRLQSSRWRDEGDVIHTRGDHNPVFKMSISTLPLNIPVVV